MPERPYVRHESLNGEDVLLQLTFINSSGVPTQPTSIQYEVDSLTTNQNIIPSTALSPTGVMQILQLPGSKMVNTRNYLGREIFQVLISAVITDTNASSGSITRTTIVIIELCNIAIPQ